MTTNLVASILTLATLSASAAPFLQPTNPPPVVQLVWDSVPGMGYNLYYGPASGQYTNRTSVGQTNSVSVTMPVRGTPYFFACTATNGGLESGFSSEVSYTPPLHPAAPTGMKQPIILTVQYKTTLEDFMWSDWQSFQLQPIGEFAVIRSAITLGPVPVLSKPTVSPPPLPR